MMLRVTSYKPYGVGFGAALSVLGVAMIWGISQLPEAAAYAAVGPKAFPRMVGAGMALTGLAVIREALVAAPAGEAVEYDVTPILLISASLIFAALALNWLGWIVSATVVFSATAWGFGERRWLASTLVGAALAAAIFVLFNFALKLNLPVGILGF